MNGWARDSEDGWKSYLGSPEPLFRSEAGSFLGSPMLDVDALEWRGVRWSHRAVLVGERSDVGIIIVTGGSPNEVDLSWAKALATASGLPALVVFDVPNQPLFGLTEDDLIAHTFDRALASGDYTWPLLLPMVKGVLQCARAASEHFGITRWIVTGASKRGWTSWLIGLYGGSSIVAIAPMLFDNIRMREQTRRQIDLWGAPSEMIEPYLIRDLPRRAEGQAGERLIAIVDPASALNQLEVPVLAINGANDPFWSIDASGLYWADVPPPRSTLFVAGLAHSLPEGEAVDTLAAFARLAARGVALPSLEQNGGGTTFQAVAAAQPLEARLYRATGQGANFCSSPWEWTPITFDAVGGRCEFTTRLDEGEAAFASATFNVEGDQVVLTTTPMLAVR